VSISAKHSAGSPSICRAACLFVVWSVLFSCLGILIRARLLPTIVSASKAQGTNESITPAVHENQQSLELLKWIEGEIAPGQSRFFLIHADAKQYFSLEVEHWGLDLAATISGPKGQPSNEFNCRQDEITRLSVIAGASGDYLLALHANADASLTGRYRLRLKNRRTIEDGDPYRILAERSMSNADQLRRRQKRESYQQAVAEYQEALTKARDANDYERQADALKGLGKTRAALNENEGALSFYVQALAISRKLKDPRIQSDILNCISYLHVSRGDNRQS